MKYKCLSIAGFDGSGGAGMQADLKTFSALGCYGMTVLTALPIQNSCGVRNCYDIPLRAIEEQLEAIFDDIIPDSIKIGMLFSAPIIDLVATFLEKHAASKVKTNAAKTSIPIILDPVMVAKSGDALLLPEAVAALKSKLIPLATIITPNLPEAYALVRSAAGSESPAGKAFGRNVGNTAGNAVDGTTESAANFDELGKQLLQLGAQAVLLKGGHAQGDSTGKGKGNSSDDLFLDQQGTTQYLRAERIDSKNTHGTGCTLSAAICAFIARGFSLFESCKKAKQYLFQAMLASKDNSVGHGHGPVHHFYHVWPHLNQTIGE
jgi:hydroxymethylpyrimidine/phosphomethylpyrimidine kinase